MACDDAQSIVSIVLGENGLVGTLPTAIYSLPNLASLSLFNNPNLVVNDFGSIQLAENLQELVLDTTALATLSGLGKARGLVALNVRNKQIDGDDSRRTSLVWSIWNSSEMSSNQFTGTIPFLVCKADGLDNFLSQQQSPHR